MNQRANVNDEQNQCVCARVYDVCGHCTYGARCVLWRLLRIDTKKWVSQWESGFAQWEWCDSDKTWKFNTIFPVSLRTTTYVCVCVFARAMSVRVYECVWFKNCTRNNMIGFAETVGEGLHSIVYRFRRIHGEGEITPSNQMCFHVKMQ